MIDKDISNLSKSELMDKYRNMKGFVIKTGFARNMSDKQIKESTKIETNTKPMDFVIDEDKSIIIRAFECTVYRNEKNQMLMITTEKFEVIG